MKKKWINILLFSLITISCSAQTGGYKFYSKLDTVITSGFYNIELTPEITARLKTDYSDLRIVNEAGKWIPHILHAPAYNASATILIGDLKFAITENSDLNTVILIESKQNFSSNIGLIITNTAAERYCTLSGSDDKKNWFVINDSIVLDPAAAENATENIFSINFPPTNYRFYRILIHNNNKDPFNIKGIVEYTESPQFKDPLNKLRENPAATIQQKDSGKVSYIKISQQLPFHFDNISLELSGVKYYKRKVGMYIPNSPNYSFSNPGELLQSFTISNNSTLQFTVPLTKASIFYLLISNDDNLPLTVKAVKTACSNHYITAYLENNNTYRLIMENKAASKPIYDLSELNTNIPVNPSLGFGKVTPVKENVVPATIEKNNKWMLWTAIAAALLILLFFSYRMLKEVDKRKTA